MTDFEQQRSPFSSRLRHLSTPVSTIRRSYNLMLLSVVRLTTRSQLQNPPRILHFFSNSLSKLLIEKSFNIKLFRTMPDFNES